MFKLILFDIDGTLIRTGGAGVKAFEETFHHEFGISNATGSLSFSGRTDTSLVREAFQLHAIEPRPENFARFFAHYPGRLEHLLRQLPGGVCEGVENFLAEVESVRPRPAIGLLTGNIRRGAELKLRHYRLWHRFPFGAFADDHEDRNCIASTAKERGEAIHGGPLQGSEILVIGDTPLDIACGKSIEAKVLAVGTGTYSAEALAKCEPAWAVDHLGKVSVGELFYGAVA
jgi:phosphoglycolate phosphatase-like HAD superfamily hydrolase